MSFADPRRTRSRAAKLAVLLLGLFLGGCLRRTLVTDVSEPEAQEIAVALYKGNLRSYISRQPKTRNQEDEKWQVEIEGGDRTQVEAWRVLQDNGLPRHHDTGIEEVYKDSQLIPTASEERARFLLALSGELGRTIKTIPGVVDARVHIVLPDPTILRDPAEKTHPTASVLIKYWENYRPPAVDQVTKLVANGVEGLDEKNISVMTSKLETPPHNPVVDLENTITPTVGLIVDYLWEIGMIVALIIAIWIVFTAGPRWIRWGKTHLTMLRDSAVGGRD